MESLAAVSLAGNIVQFIDFSTKIISLRKQLYDTNPRLEDVEVINNTVTTLSSIRLQLSDHASTVGTEPRLSLLAQECEQLAQELSDLLEETEKSGKPDGKENLLLRFKKSQHRKKLETLDTHVTRLRGEVQTALLQELIQQQSVLDATFATLQQTTLNIKTTRSKAVAIADQVDNLRRGQRAGGTDIQKLLATMVAQLNLDQEIKALTNTKDYKSVTVLPLMWGGARPPYLSGKDLDESRSELAEIEAELNDLGSVFKDRFHYDVKKVWKIPDDDTCAESSLNKKIRRLVDKHGQKESLLIILYGGHGVDTTSAQDWGIEENHSIWAPTRFEQSAIVNWSNIQKGLELSDADCLITLDCCHSGNTITRGRAKTTNEILAASTRESPSYSGARAYSKLLREKLRTIDLPCSVEQLHAEMLSASRLKPISQNENALLATPDHGWAGNSLRRSIRLRPLPVPEHAGEGSSRAMITTTNPARSRMFIEVELDDAQDMSTATAEWQRWFTAKIPPASMQNLHFYTVEDMFMKFRLD